MLQAAFEEEGIVLDFGRESVGRSNRTPTSVRLSGETLTAERLLVATGRTPNAEGLGLEQLGVEVSPRGIEVDERLRAAENVYAIGDCTGDRSSPTSASTRPGSPPPNIAGRDAKADYRAMPAVAFTDPQIATVGHTEGDGLVVRALEGREDVARLDLRAAEAARLPQARRRPEAGVLVGAVAVGPEAGEWCQQLTLAIRAEVPIETLLDVIQPFPTFSEASSGRCRSSAVKIERIVVGTDRSETATRAVTWAPDMARRYEAELIVVQAGPPPADAETELGATSRRRRPGGERRGSTPRRIPPTRSSPPPRPRTSTCSSSATSG